MNTCPLFVSSVLWPIVLLGCLGCSDTSRQTPVSAEPQPNAVVSGSESDRPQAGESFGIPNDFSGKLTEEQERHVPDALQGAFSIESLRTISTAELAKVSPLKDIVAEETRDGLKYVAIRDYRHVMFSNDVSGHMIVIERYQVVDK